MPLRLHTPSAVLSNPYLINPTTMSFKSYRRKRLMSESSSSGGVGFSGLLTVVFIALKLTGNISWPWVWVLSPLWISFLLGITFLAIAFLIAYWTVK